MTCLDLAPSDAAPARPARLYPPVDGIVVLKFGSSILRGPAEVAAVVSEIYRHVRLGEKVVAIVSAFHGQTDSMFEHARAVADANDNPHLPHYVALGEEKAAALVAVGCDRVGLKAAALSVRELGLRATGPSQAARPLGLDRERLHTWVRGHEVVVVPGFGGVDEEGRVVLLGRGGSDLTAVVVAAELGLDRVRLLKDVDGVYDGDPNAAPGHGVGRYDRLDWRQAGRVAGKLVQPQAIEAAQARGVEVEIGALQSGRISVIGAASGLASPTAPTRPTRIAVAGCGVVGGGLAARLLADPQSWELVGVLVRDCNRLRDVHVAPGLFTEDAAELLARGPDLVVDALSDAVAGEALSLAALLAGCDLVSANKAALVRDLPALRAASAESGARLGCSAAVGGEAPVLETVARAAAAGEVVSLEGVLNGTANFVIDRLAGGCGLEQAVAEARAEGFTEEDASADLDGGDAAAKLRLAAWTGFGMDLSIDEVVCRPFDPQFVREPAEWKRVRQVARCRLADGRLLAEVGLEMLPESSPLLAARREHNAVRVVTAAGALYACRGRGAGRWPTVESVLADCFDMRRSRGRI